jgi:hypothetical protein
MDSRLPSHGLPESLVELLVHRERVAALPHRDEPRVEMDPALLSQGLSKLPFRERREPPEAPQTHEPSAGNEELLPSRPACQFEQGPGVGQVDLGLEEPQQDPPVLAILTCCLHGVGEEELVQGHLQQEKLAMGAIPS